MEHTINTVEQASADVSSNAVISNEAPLPTMETSPIAPLMPSVEEATSEQITETMNIEGHQNIPSTEESMDTENKPVDLDQNNTNTHTVTDTFIEDKEMPDSATQELAPPVPSDYESSDLESSSDSSDSDSSSEEETTKERSVVVEADSDEETGVSGSGAGLRTRHELDPPPVPVIQVEIPEDAPIIPLGLISSMIDNLVVVETYISDQPQYLDAGSLLVLEDRKPLGLVFETFGPVSRPFYSVRFNDAAEIDKERIIKGKSVFSVPNMAHYVLPGSIRDKGSDASNMYDEEVDDKEMEFSDDEKEMEYKRKLKQKSRKPRQQKNNPQNLVNPPQPSYSQAPMQMPQQPVYGQQYPHQAQHYYQQNPAAYGYQPMPLHPQQSQSYPYQQPPMPHVQPSYAYQAPQPTNQPPNQPNPSQSAEQARANRMMNMYQDMY